MTEWNHLHNETQPRNSVLLRFQLDTDLIIRNIFLQKSVQELVFEIAFLKTDHNNSNMLKYFKTY